ncbi:SLOG family protein [Nocardia goodfellowii]|uniref:YspA cpYpsA-related SLOG domain-containing protein n=1 Tax=Nocardia goodfellowii TaxID=882446 RepID=A0ABS4QPF9_9NOCA|nr:SLOG family protein [Nocardia goodfellowii]MBP2193577.1 hypothetical protein [Nocardia goodfellowii]
MKKLRILLTGSRSWTDRTTVHQALAEHHNQDIALTVVHGDNPHGADRIARNWCIRHTDVTEERHPADWERHGKAAGPIRNAHMVELGADLVLAFPLPSSRGTHDCINRAKTAGIPIRIVPPGGPSEQGGLW